jgi:hypothetical protein
MLTGLLRAPAGCSRPVAVIRERLLSGAFFAARSPPVILCALLQSRVQVRPNIVNILDSDAQPK